MADAKAGGVAKAAAAPSGAAVTATAQLTALEKSLEKAIETLWMGSVMIEDFGPNTPQQLQKNIESLIVGLRTIESDARGVALSTHVPVSVIDAVDSGHNPDALLRAELATANAKTEETRGRLLATAKLRQNLQQRLAFLNAHEHPALPPQPVAAVAAAKPAAADAKA